MKKLLILLLVFLLCACSVVIDSGDIEQAKTTCINLNSTLVRIEKMIIPPRGNRYAKCSNGKEYYLQEK